MSFKSTSAPNLYFTPSRACATSTNRSNGVGFGWTMFSFMSKTFGSPFPLNPSTQSAKPSPSVSTLCCVTPICFSFATIRSSDRCALPAGSPRRSRTRGWSPIATSNPSLIPSPSLSRFVGFVWVHLSISSPRPSPSLSASFGFVLKPMSSTSDPSSMLSPSVSHLPGSVPSRRSSASVKPSSSLSIVLALLWSLLGSAMDTSSVWKRVSDP